MVCFFGFASSLQNSSLTHFATLCIRSLFFRDSRTGCCLQSGVLTDAKVYMCLPQAPAANAAGAPPVRAHAGYARGSLVFNICNCITDMG